MEDAKRNQDKGRKRRFRRRPKRPPDAGAARQSKEVVLKACGTSDASVSPGVSSNTETCTSAVKN